MKDYQQDESGKKSGNESASTRLAVEGKRDRTLGGIRRLFVALFYGNLYKSRLAEAMENVKTIFQFAIGITLILTLVAKGGFEIGQTWELVPSDAYGALVSKGQATFFQRLGYHVLHIKTFVYIASALAISAGLDLGHMLFTAGPDEAFQPLLLCVSAAAFYAISERPEDSWVIGVYVASIFGLLFCMKKYKDWFEGKEDDGKVD